MEPTILCGTTSDGVSIAWGEMGQGAGRDPGAGYGARVLSGKQCLFSDRDENAPKGFDEGVRLCGVRWQAEGDQ